MADNIFSQLLYPDAQVESSAIQRQQALANMLLQQSFQPQQEQVINGLLMPTSNIAGFSRLGQGLIANDMQSGINDRQMALNQKMADALRGRLSKFDPVQPGLTSAPADYGMGGGTGLTSGDVSGTAIPAQNPASKIDAFDVATLSSVSPEMAKAWVKNNVELPDSVRTMDLTGQDRKLFGQLATAKGRKDAMYDQAPGTLSTDMVTGKKNFLPKVSDGIALTDGVASAVPGYAGANAAIQGAQTDATERAKSKYDLTTVDAAGGPRLTSRASVLGVGEPGMGPTWTGTSTLTPQAKTALLAQVAQGDPDAIEAWAAFNKRPSAGQGVGGIELQDSASKKFNETVAGQSGEALMAGRDKAKTAAEELLTINEARNAVKAGVFQGTGAETKLAIAKFINANVPGVEIKEEKVGNTDYLKSTLGTALLAQAKTLGSNPSNADANRINDIVGTIGKDPGALQKMLDWREQMAKRAIVNHNSLVDDAEGRGLRSQYDLRVQMPEIKSTTPANIQSILDKYK